MTVEPAARERHESLDRVIGKAGFGALTLNGVIGAGIFAVPAAAAAHAGGLSPWLFAVCAVLIFPVVAAFSSAASFVRSTGGPIVYVSRAFGPFAGFQIGWLFWVARVTAFGANVVLMVSYAGWFWPALDGGWPRHVAVVGLTLLMTTLNAVGVRSGMTALFVLTLLKLAPLALVILFGLPRLDVPLLLDAGTAAPGSLGEIVLVLLYAYVGFENAVVPAGEGRNPRRDLPLALLFTTILVTGLYFLIQWTSVSVAPDLGSSERPLAAVADALMGPFGAALLALGAVFSIGGNLLAAMFGAPRLTYALALDGLLPAWFGRVHPRFHTPVNSIAFYGVVGVVLALSGSFVVLAVMSTVVRILVYASVIVSLPRLRRTSTDEARAFHLPGGMVLPVIALVICGYLVLHASVASWIATGGFALLGTALYVLERRWSAGRSIDGNP
jgi:amino acid transporter